MNVKILDSWLREYLKTKANPQTIAEKLSLTSVSIEKIEKYGDEFLYNIEVTTNRPDLMSIIGLAREASTVLPQFGIEAEFLEPDYKKFTPKGNETIEIQNDPKLVNRICAAILEVKIKESPEFIKKRLESSEIRSLNNLIDTTNYVMRETGHPAHVFDYDRLTSKKLIIRESKRGERIITLDEKQYVTEGGDIVADNGEGEIVDLLGVMGTLNSVITENTKKILYFIDNNEPSHIRRTSMSLAIRSEAAIINEKTIDPENSMNALLRGIELYHDWAEARLVSKIIDIYPNKPKSKKIIVSKEKIDKVVGVKISPKKMIDLLEKLGFKTKGIDEEIEIDVPSWRLNDIEIEEDIIEEIARVYGYHNIPSILPDIQTPVPKNIEKNEFYWEKRVKDALKYWGFTETYTYSFVSEEMYEGPIDDAVTIQNPLGTDFVYMRRTLIPSLLKVIAENKNRDVMEIFEISNVYLKKEDGLPLEKRKLAGVVKKPEASFYEVKGIIEQLMVDLGISNLIFKKLGRGGIGAEVYLGKTLIGDIEVLEDNLIDFEFDFEEILKYTTTKKTYKPLSKYPPVIEDLAIIANDEVLTGDLIEEIKKQSPLIVEVSLFDKYDNTRTFHIVYQDQTKNLTSEEVSEIRAKTLEALEKKFRAKLKE